MLKKIASILYLVSLVVLIFCVPLSAILLICKAVGALSASWLGACVPLIIALSVLPIFTLCKIALGNDNRGSK